LINEKTVCICASCHGDYRVLAIHSESSVQGEADRNIQHLQTALTSVDRRADSVLMSGGPKSRFCSYVQHNDALRLDTVRWDFAIKQFGAIKIPKHCFGIIL
jgi:hypothetical protein